MSRAQVVRAAIQRTRWQSPFLRISDAMKNELARAYDAGRVAGLREATTWDFVDKDTRESIRQYASAIAKRGRK